MARASKGSQFERDTCRLLSTWWSKGLGLDARDDIFWRSSQSGGRATQRMKSGKTTFGSYGDIAAVDPIGQPLIQAFTIELKRGSSYGTPGDLLDFKYENQAHAWVKCLAQAIRSHHQACSVSWLLICKRDSRVPIVYVSDRVARELCIFRAHSVFFKYFLQTPHRQQVRFVGLRLDSFLQRVSPKQIIQLSKSRHETE